MAGTAVRGRLTWRIGEVVKVIDETANVRSLVVNVPDWPGHEAGTHVDVRLTAEDGYQTERSYSIASAPEAGMSVEITVERIDNGEVSPYLCDELRPGDKLELRGPIGGFFVWDVHRGGPLLLVAGGSGIVPLMAMLRHRAEQRATVPTHLLYSSRTYDDIIYRAELERLAGMGDGLTVTYTLTRMQPPEWPGFSRRIDAAMLTEVAWPPSDAPLAYVCGPTPLVENVATTLVQLGHPADRVRTERFGPTGG